MALPAIKICKKGKTCEHGNGFSYCKECKAEYDRQYRLKRRNAYKNWLREIGCSCCDETHPDCLEVHHFDKNGKRFGYVSRGQASMYNVQDVEKEVALVLCANCHLIFHNSHGGRAADFPPMTEEETIEFILEQRRRIKP